MTKRNSLFAKFLCLLFLMTTAVVSKDYIVLVSGGQARSDDRMYHSEYWYDLVTAYNTLIDLGHSHEAITVCYGEGTDFNSSYPEFQNPYTSEIASITDHNNHKATIDSVLADLGTKVTSSDRVIFWWIIGHGSAGPRGREDIDMYRAFIENSGESIEDNEFRDMLNQITQYKQRIVLWATCTSGGIRNDIENDKTITMTACEFDEYHESHRYTLPGLNSVPYADFPRFVSDALRGKDIAGNSVDGDLDGNGRLAIDEAKEYSSASYYKIDNTPYNTLCLSDSANESGETYLEAFSMTPIFEEDFESGWNGWAFYVDWAATAEAYVMQDTDQNSALVSYIGNLGSESWHVHARKDGITLVEGKRYTIRFDARAESGLERQIAVKLEQAVSPYTNYSNAPLFQIDGTMRTYEYSFVMGNSTDTNSGVCFEMGKFEDSTPIDVIIDNVVIEEEE